MIPRLTPSLPDASAFAAEGRAPACLLLHGFTGTPFEVRPLGEALLDAGFAVHAPLLPGHGTEVGDLMERRREDWCRASEAAAEALAERYGPIVVVGLSLGGLLALRLAALRPELVRGVVALATALRLRAWNLVPLAALSRLDEVPPIPIPKVGGSDIRDVAMRRRNPAYPAQPLRSAVELYRLGVEVEALLGRVSAPLLAVHGLRDHTVSPESTELVLRGVGSTERHRLILEEAGHVLPLDLGREKLLAEVVRFVRRLAEGGAPG